MTRRIKDLVRATVWLVVGELALGLGRVLSVVMHKLEDTMADEGNGPKEQAALDALDQAIEALAEWRDAEDEHDAGQIATRTARVQELMRPRPGEAIDSATGVAVPVNRAEPGPTSSTPPQSADDVS